MVSLFCGCGVLLFLSNWTPEISLLINRWQWERSKPSAYYVEVIEHTAHKGSWHWAIYVQESQPTTFTLLKTTEPKGTSWLNPKEINLELIFDLAGRCARAGIVYCGLEFDPQFHFPTYMVDYPDVIVEVKHFIPCEQNLSNCQIGEKVLPSKSQRP